ncbi:MAG: pilus assembly protein TadG-related protein [Chloroflexi bacterium]|nr:pilus assembly protein TadG-related protein [Chloroflexota bacterium]
MAAWLRGRGAGSPAARGQVLVLFALGLVMLLGAAGIAFDAGRFIMERRSLQNAADAAALAAADSLIRGGTDADADAEARAVLATNLAHGPNGIVAPLPPASPVYAPGGAGNPAQLVNGILVSGGDVRVAIQNTIPFTFGRAVGLATSVVGARAHVRLQGDLLPIAVRHFLNAPGPTSGAVYPCDGDTRNFQDLISTADTACLGTEVDGSLRTMPSAGAAFDAANPGNDPARHGPITTLVGQGAAPGNNASFRGFVVLDIRNFASATSNVFYNGVTAGSNPNTLKAKEAGWVATGYPGPAFPPATAPPDPNDQVGIMDGNSAGIVVDAIRTRYAPGDEILAAVYSGSTMTIPDFTYAAPSAVSIGTTQNRDDTIAMSVTKNSSFNGTVTTTAFPDWGDPANPLATGALAPITFAPDPATPPTTVLWHTFRTVAAPVGVSTVWIKGHSSSPYLTDHYYPVAINVGGVARDFSSTGGGQVFAMDATGQTATGSITFATTNNTATYFGGSVTLTLEGGPDRGGALPTGIGAASISPSSFTLNKNGSVAVSVAVNGGTLGPGEYQLTIRATGTNAAGQTVTHQVPILLDIATAGTSNEYVDIMGFTVFRITAVGSNNVDGYAITGVYPDMNDAALRLGQEARLVPW